MLLFKIFQMWYAIPSKCICNDDAVMHQIAYCKTYRCVRQPRVSCIIQLHHIQICKFGLVCFPDLEWLCTPCAIFGYFVHCCRLGNRDLWPVLSWESSTQNIHHLCSFVGSSPTIMWFNVYFKRTSYVCQK